MSTLLKSPSGLQDRLSLTEWQVTEWLRCRNDILYWAKKYVWIQDRAQKATIRFEAWPHVVEILDDLQHYRFLIYGKARQVAGSWTISGVYATHLCKFFENVKVLMFSQGQVEAIELLGKSKFVDDHLPDWMLGLPRNPDSAQHIKFPDTDSEIVAYPSTEKAGRSTDATLVITDEAEKHEAFEVNMASIRPTISGGGQHVILSTADPLVTIDHSYFKQLYSGAPENGYKRRFYGWRVRPGRDDEWLKNETKGMPAWSIAGEYPSTEEEMLATLKTMPYFDDDVLKSWLGGAEPIRVDELAKYSTVKVWKPRIVGRKYVLYNDPSDGKTDPHVIICKDMVSGEWAATSHAMVAGDYCAEIHDAMVRYFNNAFNSFEINAIAGGIVSQKLSDLETPNQCKRLNTEGKIPVNEKRFGQFTGKQSKRIQRERLEEFIRTQAGRIYDEDGIRELLSFQRIEGESEPRSPRGGHDDYIAAGGGVEWMASRYGSSSQFRLPIACWKPGRRCTGPSTSLSCSVVPSDSRMM